MKLLHFLFMWVAMTAVFAGCDQNPQMMDPVMEEMMDPVMEEMTDAPETETLPPMEAPAEINYEDLPLIESAFLEPGLYRIDPKGSSSGNFKLIYLRQWVLAEEVPDCESTFLSNDKEFCRNSFVHIILNPQPWAQTATGQSIYRPGRNIFVVEITKNLGVSTEKWGRVVNTLYAYEGKLLKNLTFPDIPIEFEE